MSPRCARTRIRARALGGFAPLVLALAAVLAIPAPAAPFWPRPAARQAATAAPGPTVGPTQDAGDAPATPVTLRVQELGGHYEAVVRNHAPGPMQVRLVLARAGNLQPVPALPTEAVVRAGTSTVIARLYPLDSRTPNDLDLRLEQVPGDPHARPLDHAYRLPFAGAPVRVDQGFDGHYSHDDDANRYAVDFALPEGTPVLAARDGVVLQVESGHAGSGADRERDGGRANYLRILHDDGSMAVYAHLEPAGVQVRVGQAVRAGERIAISGNTGFSTAPHLHFAVQVNAGMRLAAIPFRMISERGELKFARDATVPAATPVAPVAQPIAPPTAAGGVAGDVTP